MPSMDCDHLWHFGGYNQVLPNNVGVNSRSFMQWLLQKPKMVFDISKQSWVKWATMTMVTMASEKRGGNAPNYEGKCIWLRSYNIFRDLKHKNRYYTSTPKLLLSRFFLLTSRIVQYCKVPFRIVLPMSVRWDKVETAMHSVAHNILPIQTTFVFVILGELLFDVINNWCPPESKRTIFSEKKFSFSVD